MSGHNIQRQWITKLTKTFRNEQQTDVLSNMPSNIDPDPRLDQLVVYSSKLEHLLQQKLHYEHERDMELLRLERFKDEGAKANRIHIQMQVVKKMEAMLPDIVYKMRNEYDKLYRFLHREYTLKDLDVQLYDKGCQLLIACKMNLDQAF